MNRLGDGAVAKARGAAEKVLAKSRALVNDTLAKVKKS